MGETKVDALKKLNMAELKSELSIRGLSVNGKKEELLIIFTMLAYIFPVVKQVVNF